MSESAGTIKSNPRSLLNELADSHEPPKTLSTPRTIQMAAPTPMTINSTKKLVVFISAVSRHHTTSALRSPLSNAARVPQQPMASDQGFPSGVTDHPAP